ncbi:SDR family oxidoreductase [Zavarzinella formosa]|uniref:SDR family oxidoreductase n=1 Tax=Zavarzinella formosa TaxID=360055 RepID=UPI0002F7347A|nr:SDR family oxidoreductase [Zavarzinella formosa]
MGRFTGKKVLVTGGGSGVGQATARLFAQEGAMVAIAGRDAAKLAETAKGLPEMLVVPTDVTDPKAVEALFKTVLAKFGHIDILVNNAGTNLKARTMRELTVENWHKLINTNLDGAFYCIKSVLPGMIERKDGIIVNVNSVSGKRPYPLAGAGYAAGKFGLHALAGCLASEEMESGIRVSTIYPGEIDTPILVERPTPVSAEQRAKILKAEDVANAILFVSSLPPHVSVPELIIKPTSQVYF